MNGLQHSARSDACFCGQPVVVPDLYCSIGKSRSLLCGTLYHLIVPYTFVLVSPDSSTCSMRTNGRHVISVLQSTSSREQHRQLVTKLGARFSFRHLGRLGEHVRREPALTAFTFAFIWYEYIWVQR